MEWLEANIVDIVAIIGMVIGSAYAVARAIVALTPTPKDDEALERVSIVVRAIAKAFGLDLKQGVHTKDAGPGKVGMILLCFFLLLPSCAVFEENPRANLVASQELFSATVDSLTVLLKAGKFSEEEKVLLTIFIHEGERLLLQWEADIGSGRDSPDVIRAFDAVLDKLIAYQIQKGQ